METKRRNKWVVGIFATGFLIFILTMGLPAMAKEGKKVFDVKMAHHWPPKHPCGRLMQKFADGITKRTSGRMKFSVYPSGQLFPQGEEASSVGQGLVEFGAAMGSEMEEVDKGFVLESLMWIWDGYAQMRSLWVTEVGKKHLANAEKGWNIKILGRNPMGPFLIWTKDKPLMRKEDYAGLKIRAFSAAQPPQYEALGGSAINLRTPEVYTALQSRMIDALPTTPSGMRAYSWWDFLKVANMPYVLYGEAYIAANANFWNRLPADLQNIILQVGAEVTKEGTDTITARGEKFMYNDFVKEHGGKVVTMPASEMIRIKKAILPAWQEIAKDVDPKLWQETLKLIGLQ